MPNHPAHPRHVHAIEPLDRGEFRDCPRLASLMTKQRQVEIQIPALLMIT